MVNEPYVAIEDVANHFAVSISTVRKWMRHDLIPVLRLDGVFRFKLSEVEQSLRKLTEGYEAEELKEVDPRQLEINFDPEEDL